jgi:hypothetical protein
LAAPAAAVKNAGENPAPGEKEFFYLARGKNKIFENLLKDWNYRFIFYRNVADRSAKRHF